jgi:hypothetical protein
MAAVAGVGVASDEAGEAGIAPYLTSGGNNVEQQLLPLMLTACRGRSGVKRSPFRASQVVRGMPECSRIYTFNG